MRAGAGQARPNVVLVLIDTLRADHLSCYGYDRVTSPCIDRIAERGVVFENAISAAPWTPPAHASIFTGTYPSRHGVDRSRLVLRDDLVPLPEVLRRHGYRTYGISSNYWLSRETRFNRGFDRFVHSWQLVQTGGGNAPLERQNRKQGLALETLNGGAEDGGWLHTCGNALNSAYERGTRALRRSWHVYDDGAWRVNATVRGWAREWKRDRAPFFAFVHYLEPHLRYAPPGRYRHQHLPRGVDDRRIAAVNQDPWRYLTGRARMDAEDFAILRGLYDGEISYVDQRVGQLHAALQQQGLLDNTLFIVTSDHGENIGDHQLMDHVYCLYDTLLRVPLVVSGLAEFPAGQRVTDQVQTPDLFPTILRLAGIEEEETWRQVQAPALFPGELRGQPERVAIAEYLEPQPPVGILRKRYPDFDASRFDRTLRTVRADGFKYVCASDGKDELYAVASDPDEERNLIDAEPDVTARMRKQLDEWLASFSPAHATDEELELDAAMRERLENLGYLA